MNASVRTWLNNIQIQSLFDLSLLLFVFALPISSGLVSVSAGLLLVSALIDSGNSWKVHVIQRWWLLPVMGVFVLYLGSTLLEITEGCPSFYDVRKMAFYVVLPLAFMLGPALSKKQILRVFFVFCFSVFLALAIALARYLFNGDHSLIDIRKITLVSHIRFGFQLVLAALFGLCFYVANRKVFGRYQSVLFYLFEFIILSFLVFQQSLTGIVGAVVVVPVFVLLQFKSQILKSSLLKVLIILMLLVPVVFLVVSIQRFYDFDVVHPEQLPRTTAKGNLYTHHLDRPDIENGHYVYLYLCEKELREEWNKRASVKYDSIGTNGYRISSTLIRYLTSKGLPKDAEGVRALSKEDIRNVEKGIANVIYARKFSLYARIYQTIWEFYNYTAKGYSNRQSFAQRIVYAKAAVWIIRNHPWTGVGTQHWREEFARAFHVVDPKLDERLYASSHNQYLNFAVKFGIPGALFILFLLVFPVVRSGAYRNRLFLLFLLFMIVVNFADSNLESHMGSSFFLFFYCLFLTSSHEKGCLSYRLED